MKLRYIFIPFLAIFLMSHNVSALTLNIPVQEKDRVQSPYFRYYTSGVGDSSWSNGMVTRTDDQANITRLQLRDNANHDIAFTAGDYIELNFWVERVAYFTPSNYPPSYFAVTKTSSNCNIISIDLDQENYSIIANPDRPLDDARERYYGSITCSLRNSGTNPTINLTIKSNALTASGSVNTIYFGINSYTVYTPTPSDADKEEQATQDASDDSENASNEANEDVESGTSNLLDVFGGFVTAISGASASNCVVNAPLNTTFSNDRLNVDLCALDLPTPIGVLTSIIAILVVVPFAISMFNKFIGIIGSFQQ